MKPASSAFWHADPEIERSCSRGPRHLWGEFRAGDVFTSAIDPDERITFCATCYVLRCGQPNDGRGLLGRHGGGYSECNLPITHTPPHRDQHGKRLDPWPDDQHPSIPRERPGRAHRR